MSKAQKEKEQKKLLIEREIIEASIPLIEKEGVRALTIREICENAGITTGMFYRHFMSKNDLASFCFILAIARMIEGIDALVEGKPLPEQLVTLFCEVVKCNKLLSRDGILVFLNNTNPKCDCSVSRNMLYEVTERLIRSAVENGFVLSGGRTARQITDDLIVLEKGILFEWFGREPDYDVLEEARKLFVRVIDSLL